MHSVIHNYEICAKIEFIITLVYGKMGFMLQHNCNNGIYAKHASITSM